jgi:hypothetical protein
MNKKPQTVELDINSISNDRRYSSSVESVPIAHALDEFLIQTVQLVAIGS